MIFYSYKGKNLNGDELDGQCTAEGIEELVKTLRDKGFYLVRYNVIKKRKRDIIRSQMTEKHLALLCRQFYTTLSAGINLNSAIAILQKELTNKYLSVILNDIEKMVQKGQELSSCMKYYPNIFPEFLVSMVKLGEASGKLDKIFDMMSKFYSNEYKIKNKIKKAVLYPCILLFTSIIIFHFIIAYIIPVFVSTLNELNGSIPMVTKIIIKLNSFTHENYIIISVFFILSILLIKYFAGIDSGKMLIHKALIRNIITGSISRKFIAVKFSRSLGILLSSGIQVVRAFEITMNILGNEYIKHLMVRCINDIKEGRNISNAVRNLNIFPEILCSMIAIGEETGSLDEMMLSISETLDEELYSTIERMSALLEPTMIAIMSLVIGTILISALMPMFNIMDII